MWPTGFLSWSTTLADRLAATGNGMIVRITNKTVFEIVRTVLEEIRARNGVVCCTWGVQRAHLDLLPFIGAPILEVLEWL